jgi:hypothetical protein
VPLSETLNAPRCCWCSPPATLIHGTVQWSDLTWGRIHARFCARALRLRGCLSALSIR